MSDNSKSGSKATANRRQTSGARTTTVGLGVWFAWRDLTRPGARRTTLVSAVTVAVVTALTLIIFGLCSGYEAIRQDRIVHDPLTLCIWVGDPRYQSTRVSPEKLAMLREKVPAALDDSTGFLGCCPFREVRGIDWFLAAEGRRDYSVELLGRTIAPDDPLFESRPLRSPSDGGAEQPAPNPIELLEQGGAIITPRLLEEVYWEEGAGIPETLRIRSPGGDEIEVPVRGITKQDLPLGHLFVITEEYLQEISTESPPVENVATGPVPDDWPAPADLPEAVQEALDVYGILTPLEEATSQGRIWLLRSMVPSGFRKSTWVLYARQLQAMMTACGFKEGSQFAQVQLRGSQPAGSPPREDYDRVMIRLKEAQYLKPARDAVTEDADLGIPVFDSEDTLEKLAKLDDYARQLRSFSLGIVLALAFTAGWNLLLIQSLRIEQKTEEIGMLKAMGMTSGAIQVLYVVEAALLWFAGFLLGCTAAWPAGKFLFGPSLLSDTATEAKIAFQITPAVLALTLVISPLVCLLATWIATRNAVRRSPIETLYAN